MERTDQADGQSSVPSLINEYRSQEDAHRAQTRELARLQQEVFTTAAREANDIVSTARGEVRRVILQARRDLLMLAAQVDVIGNMATDGAAPPDGTPRTLSAARQDLRQVLHEAGQEFQTVTNYAQALQSQTAQFQALPAADAPAEPTTIPVQPNPWDEVPPATPPSRQIDTPLHTTQAARGTRTFVVAFALVGLAVVAGTLWWMAQSPDRTNAAAPVAASQPSTTPNAPAETVTTPTAPPPAEPPAAPVPSLSVDVQRQAWIRIVQDGRVLVERIAQPGDAFRITDAHQVAIRSGDAGAVLVSINGGEAMPLGRDGQVLTRTIVLNETEAPPPATPPVQPQIDVKPTTPPAPAPAPSASAAPPADAGERAQSPVAATAPPAPQPREETPLVASRAAAAPPPLRDTPAATNGTGTAAPPAPPAPTPPNPQTEIARAAERWMDAYYRQDRATMASLSAPQLILSDERVSADRLPPGLSSIRRDIQDAKVSIFGSDALYVARVTERLDTAPAGSAPGAFVSQMWTMRDGAWRLTNVRIVSATSVSRSVR